MNEEENKEELKAELTYMKEIAEAYQSIRDNVADFKNMVCWTKYKIIILQ